MNSIGFKRRKRELEWRRKIDAANSEWIHFNFGLGIVNPSFGVHYTDLNNLVPQELGVICSVVNMLEGISGCGYSSETKPTLLAEHVIKYVLPKLVELRDRPTVIQQLESESPGDWPVWGRSARIRLLPLMLANIGKLSEALDRLTAFEKIAPSIDQQRPEYAEYAKFFRATIAKL